MKKVHILCDYTKIVDYTVSPIRYNKKALLNRGYKIDFFYSFNDKLLNCDILLLISKPTLTKLKERQPIIKHPSPTLNLLAKARKYVNKIIWLDNSDSTTVTHFELLPYIDLYLKKQLLIDKSLYTKNFTGGRIFTDYYNKNFNIHDNLPFNQYYPLKSKYFSKVQLAWNIGLGDMYNSFTKKSALRRKAPKIIPFKYNKQLSSPYSKKNTDIFIRTSANLSRELIAFHRKKLVNLLDVIIQKHNLSGSTTGTRLSTKMFRAQLSDTKIMPSPFGWGELGVRDYEAFIFGSLLLKPDLSHMETWPSIFIKDETYVPFKWSFEDLEPLILEFLSNDKERIRIAKNGQEAYCETISKKGMDQFCDWFINQIEK